MQTNETNALDAYLKQVEMYLPPWNAAEIVREIRSHVLDQAEGVAAERGVEMDAAVVREVLDRLGSPQRLAAGYVPAVTLIRPEYTLPLAIYSVAAVALLVPLLFVGGLGAWLGSAVCVIGLIFGVFVALSRLPEVYRLPIWHSRLGRLPWRVDVGRALRAGVHAIWPQPAMAGAGPMDARPTDPVAMSGASAASGTTGASGGVVSGPVGGDAGSWPSPSPSTPRRSPTEWLVAHSGPRHLRIHELFGAGLRAVFGFALALFFVFAPATFPLLDLRFDDPQRGWRLVLEGPGLEAVRELGAIACMATCLSGLLPIFLGKGRLSLYGQILAQGAWAGLLYQLMVGGTVFSLAFTTVGWIEKDWPQAHSAIQSAVPLALGIGLLLTLLSLVCTLVKLGMMEAWYRSQRDAV